MLTVFLSHKMITLSGFYCSSMTYSDVEFFKWNCFLNSKSNVNASMTYSYVNFVKWNCFQNLKFVAFNVQAEVIDSVNLPIYTIH